MIIKYVIKKVTITKPTQTIVINADVNGALNILRKVAGDSSVRAIAGSGRVNRPVRVRLPWGGLTPHEAPSVRAG